MINFAKKIRNYLVLSMVILAICLLPTIPSSVVFASEENSMEGYYQFDKALSQMLQDYDSIGGEMVALASLDEEEPQNQSTNRLIVETNSKLDDCGAVAKAEFKDYHIFQYSNFEDAENAFNYYNNLENVEVGYDFVVSTNNIYENEIEVDSTYSYMSWGAKYVGYQTYTESMLASTSQNNLADVVVAVVDSGINTSHKIFENRILFEYGKNFAAETSSTSYEFEDMNGHGTHVSGTIAESTLSNVKILPLKVLKANGRGYVSSIVSAVEYALQLKATGVLPNLKVMNMSIGVDDSSSVDSNGVSSKNVGAYSTSLNNAVVNAYNKGVLSVVSAGNKNRNTAYASPANVDCVLTISALKEEYDFVTGKKLVFHGEWHDYDGYSNYGSHVDFCAPGTDIRSAYKGSSSATADLSGTSMAAPHATAVVALVYSNPTYKNYDLEDLVTLLKENADKSDLYTSGVYSVSASERDDYYGYGLISVKNIGLITSGYINFSKTEEFPNEKIEVELSYDGEVDTQAGEYTKIFYSTQEDVVALDINSSVAKLYSSAVEISSTTKLTAVACIYDKNGVLIRKSFSTSQTYYYDNIDLSTNFVFEETTQGLTISKYNGKLTTLKIKDKINSKYVVGINESAFKDSNVEILYLPAVSNFKINSRAFYSYSKLKEIHSDCSSLQIGNEAFRYCTNLSKVNLENAIKIGDYAFANNTNMTSLYLLKVTEIGQHSFSGSGLKQLMIGQNVEIFKTQSSMSLEKIWGYSGTVAETFALENEIEFYDLSLKIEKDLAKRKILRKSENAIIEFDFVAFRPSFEIESDIPSIYCMLVGKGDYSHRLLINISNMSIGKHSLSVDITDVFGNKITSSSISVVVLSDDAQTHTLNFDSGNFEVYINDEPATDETVLFDGYDYEIKIVAKAGYEIKNILVGGSEKESPIYVSANQDVDLEVSTKEKAVLSADFVLEAGGKVFVGGQEVDSADVERNQTLQFEVVPDTGYAIKYVKHNGEFLNAENGVYSIENITSDISIEVDFELLRYEVNLTYGKGGSVFRRGVFAESSDITYGSDLVFDVVCSDGYVVDFVKVNGKEINLTDNTFVVENIDQDCDIVVSFKMANVSLFDNEHSHILRYFIVFCALFVIFVIAKIVLTIYRKKEQN